MVTACPSKSSRAQQEKKTTLELFLFLAGWSDATFAAVGCGKVYRTVTFPGAINKKQCFFLAGVASDKWCAGRALSSLFSCCSIPSCTYARPTASQQSNSCACMRRDFCQRNYSMHTNKWTGNVPTMQQLGQTTTVHPNSEQPNTNSVR